MKIKNAVAGMMLCLAMVSCIQDEALNVEAAIDGCSGSNIQLSTINNSNKTVSIYVPKSTDLSALEINFELPEGASIEPVDREAKDNAPKYDFSNSGIPNQLEQYQRKFKVTSESGTTEATYTIKTIISELPTQYHFETIENGNTEYDIFYELNPDSANAERLQWASGNPGFKLTGMAKSSADYPTMQTEGYQLGKGVKLETKSTGTFGTSVKMPIAAGNLFIGSFDTNNALTAPRAATKFGFPFFKHPVSMTGYYKFKPGGDYISGIDENKKPIFDESMKGKDKGDIYAILYEANSIDVFLDGSIKFDDSRIVSIARIPSTETTDDWTRFDLPFDNKKAIDENALSEGKYKLAIVFSSSIEGAYFKGSVGSTLWIDEVTIHCEEDNEQYN